MIIEYARYTQNSEIIEVFESNELRPIVWGPKCSTKKLSQIIDILLKPFLKHIKSFIQESGLEDTDHFLTKYQEDLHPRFQKEYVLESAKFILKNNTLAFDSILYLQTKETVMGTVFASPYAKLIMGYHEIKDYSIICQSYTLSSKHLENSWFRFLEDSQI